MKNVSEIIDALGGQKEAAKILQVTQQAVCNWKRRGGIPASYARLIVAVSNKGEGEKITYADVLK
tara:strand:+ start:155 stop:349 length:195 start_codon:yes stop_codon:yes gene_type:complete